MTPRSRKRENKHLKDVKNLYPRTINGKTYYYFEHPITHKSKSLGSDLVSALEKATLLNAALESAGITKQKSKRKKRTLSDVIKVWKPRELEGLKPNPAQTKGNQIDYITKAIGGLSANQVTTGDLYEFTRHYAPSTQKRLKQQLKSLFSYCLSTGERIDGINPATDLLVDKPLPVQRKRLTLEHYQAIRAESEPWMKSALDLMLATTLRPGDLLKLKWTQYNGRSITLGLEKTGAKLEIELGPLAQQAISELRQSGLVCPYIVHRKPARRRHRKNCDHFFQVELDLISGKFSEIRDKLGIHADLPAAQRPCLYEVRSLSSRLYKDKGFNIDYVQALMGHTDSDMTQIYQDERDQRKAQVVSAGLDLTIKG